MKREDLLLALNETTHALRFVEAAGNRFTLDAHEIEQGSATAASVAFISNRLDDSRTCLSSAKDEISRLIEENEVA